MSRLTSLPYRCFKIFLIVFLGSAVVYIAARSIECVSISKSGHLNLHPVKTCVSHKQGGAVTKLFCRIKIVS
ncbi:MAG: hypothetical protein CVV49_01295 [Spirochaetae bacterium HGW-Spirochaetae-5]|nr:MAG: hypothetical protein CVV49_01295 [Spirochaetae bacterium HGW-Spirochaetae-5]